MGRKPAKVPMNALLILNFVLMPAAIAGFYLLAGLTWRRALRPLFAVFGRWQLPAVYCWVILSGLLVGPSLLTFGWFGAGFGAYFGPFSPTMMAIGVPTTTAIGAGVAGMILTLAIFGVVTGLDAIWRTTRCPLFGRRRAGS